MSSRALRRSLSICALLAIVLATTAESFAAVYRTPNFIVHAPTEDFAQRVGQEAERFRKELAVMWAGQEMPNWSAPCPIKCRVGQIGAGGATTFHFQNGEVLGWNMSIQGSEERILDSVLPHEITHTVLACIFRRPLPRWADEGMSTLIEHESERRRQTRLLDDVMKSGRKIPLKNLLAMTEYPQDGRDVMKLYAQGYSLTDYLVQQGGRNRFLRFLNDAHRHGSWDQALKVHYGLQSVNTLEKKWGGWVIAGSPSLKKSDGTMLASNDANSIDEAVVRAQSPAPTATPRAKAGHSLATSQPAQGMTTSRQNSTETTIARATSEPSIRPLIRNQDHLSHPVYIRTVQRISFQSASNTKSRCKANSRIDTGIVQ